MLFLFQELKPRLHEQFLCGNCMRQFLFPRVDGSTNICCSFPSVIILHSGDARGKAKSKMAKVRRRARRAGGANVRDWVLRMTLKKLSHFMWRLVYTDNFFVAIFICHIKTNTPAFQQMQLSHKNWSFLIIYTGK